jgi:5-methylcytosine-specific restriction protein A
LHRSAIDALPFNGKFHSGQEGSAVQIVMFGTHADMLPGVLEHSMHALDFQPNMTQGDIILIARTMPLPRGQLQIQHRMAYLRSRVDRDGDTDRIWGRHWTYIIEGNDLRRLRNPFNVANVQGLIGNYAQGDPIVYLPPRDQEVLRRGGYLDQI